jgi:hypothetical protein
MFINHYPPPPPPPPRRRRRQPGAGAEVGVGVDMEERERWWKREVWWEVMRVVAVWGGSFGGVSFDIGEDGPSIHIVVVCVVGGYWCICIFKHIYIYTHMTSSPVTHSLAIRAP